MSKEKPEDYIVTAAGLDDHKVGSTIKLTETQAKARVNKVKLKSEFNSSPKVDKMIHLQFRLTPNSMANCPVID